jgi:hypothetical protein
MDILQHEYRRLNRTQMFTQQFSISPLLRRFLYTQINVDLTKALAAYVRTWLIANSDLEFVLRDFELNANRPNYDDDDALYQDGIPPVHDPAQDDSLRARRNAVAAGAYLDFGPQSEYDSTMTARRHASRKAAHAFVARVLHQVTHPLHAARRRHRIVRKKLLAQSPAACGLPQAMWALGNAYYRMLSWRMSVVCHLDSPSSSYLQPSGPNSLQSSQQDESYWESFYLYCEMCAELLFPHHWAVVRHEITRLFRSHYFNESIRRHRARAGATAFPGSAAAAAAAASGAAGGAHSQSFTAVSQATAAAAAAAAAAGPGWSARATALNTLGAGGGAAAGAGPSLGPAPSGGKSAPSGFGPGIGLGLGAGGVSIGVSASLGFPGIGGGDGDAVAAAGGAIRMSHLPPVAGSLVAQRLELLQQQQRARLRSNPAAAPPAGAADGAATASRSAGPATAAGTSDVKDAASATASAGAGTTSADETTAATPAGTSADARSSVDSGSDGDNGGLSNSDTGATGAAASPAADEATPAAADGGSDGGDNPGDRDRESMALAQSLASATEILELHDLFPELYHTRRGRPTHHQFNTQTQLDIRSPLLDCLLPSFSSLREYQSSMLAARAHRLRVEIDRMRRDGLLDAASEDDLAEAEAAAKAAAAAALEAGTDPIAAANAAAKAVAAASASAVAATGGPGGARVGDPGHYNTRTSTAITGGGDFAESAARFSGGLRSGLKQPVRTAPRAMFSISAARPQPAPHASASMLLPRAAPGARTHARAAAATASSETGASARAPFYAQRARPVNETLSTTASFVTAPVLKMHLRDPVAAAAAAGVAAAQAQASARAAFAAPNPHTSAGPYTGGGSGGAYLGAGEWVSPRQRAAFAAAAGGRGPAGTEEESLDDLIKEVSLTMSRAR